MTTGTVERTQSFTELVAAEIRAAMGRLAVRQSQLARRLGVNDTWLSVRLRGLQPIDVNDLKRIAVALDVSVGELLPAEVRGHTHYDAAPVDPLAPRVIATIGEARPATTPRRPVRQTRPLGAQNRPLSARRRPLTPSAAQGGARI